MDPLSPEYALEVQMILNLQMITNQMLVPCALELQMYWYHLIEYWFGIFIN